MSDRYIEVVGEGRFEERPSRFVAAITVQVRAGKGAAALDELDEFWRAVVSTLRQAGLTDDEIVEGGTSYFHPWYSKKKSERFGVRKVILKVRDFGRMNAALAELEPLQSGERKSIAVNMRQPDFDAGVEEKAAAFESAFAEAHSKAARLAQLAGVELGPVIHIEEGRSGRRGSGFSGDEDWGGDSDRFGPSTGVVMLGAPGSADDESEFNLQTATRSVFVKCRVRFEIGERS